MNTQDTTAGLSFFRSRGTRIAVGAASVAGFTLIGAVPAFAATDADCAAGNTVDAGAGGTAAQIQTLLDADTATICLSGTFAVTAPLTFDHTLTVYGLSSAVLDGGNISGILSGSTEFADVTLQNLTLRNGQATIGGAVAVPTVTVLDSVFENNSGTLGGAIAAQEATITRSTFVGNQAELGGAIFSYSSVETTQSTFENNEANGYGGAIFGYDFGSFTASTFVGNTALAGGGALYLDDEVYVENSTFVNNSSAEGVGGAVIADYGTILQSTFLDNTAPEGAGDALAGSDDIELRGNIFAGESTNPQLALDDVFTDLGGNVFSTTTEPALVDVQTSTQFEQSVATVFDGATLANNGGPTETVALYAGSPAIDGVPVGEPSVTVDQRGVSRDALSDSGAYEYSETAVLPVKPVPAPAPVLAATGSSTDGWLVGAGALMLALGGVVLATVRRRRA